MLYSDPRMVESGRVVLFPLFSGVINRVLLVALRGIAARSRYSPIQAFAAVLFTILIDWSRPDMAGWYRYDFTAEAVFPVVVRRTKQGSTCPGSEPCTRGRSLKLDRKARMAAAMEKAKRETDCAVVDRRQRYN